MTTPIVTFVDCDPCPRHTDRELPPDTVRTSAGTAAVSQLTDPALRVMLQVMLSRAWLFEHGPRPEQMVFHVGPLRDGRHEVALTGIPDWADE